MFPIVIKRPWKVMESHGPTTGQRRANYCPFACVKLPRTTVHIERACVQLMFGLHVQLWLCRCLDCERRLRPTTSVSGKLFDKYAWNNPRLWALWTSINAPLVLPPPCNSWSLKMSYHNEQKLLYNSYLKCLSILGKWDYEEWRHRRILRS